MKALVIATEQPYTFHAATESPYTRSDAILNLLCVVALLTIKHNRLTFLAGGLIVGAILGNVGELLVFGRVTDFVPIGDRIVTSPADLFWLAGFVLALANFAGSLWGLRRAPRT